MQKRLSWYSECWPGAGTARTWCIFTWRPVCMGWTSSERKRTMVRRAWSGKGRKRSQKRREQEAVSKTTHQQEKEKWERWPTSSGGIQIHVDAAQSGVHHFSTYSPSFHPRPTVLLPPQLSNTHLTPFSDRLFDTRPGVPIDLGGLKSPGNHRRQLLRAPLSGTSRGYIDIHSKRSLFTRGRRSPGLA